MGFKYEEDRTFIVCPKDRDCIYAHEKDYDISVELNICDLYRVTCYGGKFHVRNSYVSMRLTEKQMNMYFKKPYVGSIKD